MQGYKIWTKARSWCDYDIEIEEKYLPAIRMLFPAKWEGDSHSRTDVAVQLVPEPDCPRSQWAVSVRAEGRTVGYISDEDAPQWAGTIRRVVASGFLPVTSSNIWGSEYDGWDGVEFNTSVRIALGDPSEALPTNGPPTSAYTMLPRSSIVQVTKEEQYFDNLRMCVPPGGYGPVFVTLHESEGPRKPYVEVRIDDAKVGQLTPAMSLKFLPLIRHLKDRGLVTACWGDITGSQVAAEVRIDAVKANEADDAVLNGDPITVPRLMPPLAHPGDYDLSVMQQLLAPPPLVQKPQVAIAPEPPDGSVVPFTKGNGRYVYVAVRRGSLWQTTATGDWGSINEQMQWRDLAAKVKHFDIATKWADIKYAADPRIREHLAVIRFTINNLYLAAINIDKAGSIAGDWYTTITDRAEDDLPFGDYADWSDIAEYGQHIQVVTAWAQLV